MNLQAGTSLGSPPLDVWLRLSLIFEPCFVESLNTSPRFLRLCECVGGCTFCLALDFYFYLDNHLNTFVIAVCQPSHCLPLFQNPPPHDLTQRHKWCACACECAYVCVHVCVCACEWLCMCVSFLVFSRRLQLQKVSIRLFLYWENTGDT